MVLSRSVYTPGQQTSHSKHTQAAPVEVGEYRSPALLHPDQDTAFLQDLDRTGTIYDSAGVAIHNARLVCKMLAAGRTEDAIAADFTRAAETQAGKSEVFVSISVQHYCPTEPPI